MTAPRVWIPTRASHGRGSSRRFHGRSGAGCAAIICSSTIFSFNCCSFWPLRTGLKDGEPSSGCGRGQASPSQRDGFLESLLARLDHGSVPTSSGSPAREGDLDHVEVARCDRGLEDLASFLEHRADVVAGGDVDERRASSRPRRGRLRPPGRRSSGRCRAARGPPPRRSSSRGRAARPRRAARSSPGRARCRR